MDFCSIASGSSGNCIYVGSDQTSVLIDTGISRKRIRWGGIPKSVAAGKKKDAAGSDDRVIFWDGQTLEQQEKDQRTDGNPKMS